VDERAHAAWGAVYRSDVAHPNFAALPGLAVKVYCLLLTYSTREHRTAWPKQATLGGTLGAQRQHINRAIGQLESGGFLKRHKMYRDRTPYTVYAITSPC
jgi:hypothetical protein